MSSGGTPTKNMLSTQGVRVHIVYGRPKPKSRSKQMYTVSMVSPWALCAVSAYAKAA